MKKLIALLMALVVCLGLCACGAAPAEPTAEPTEAPTPEPTEDPTIKLALGETAATDLAEFTLHDACFTYYVSNSSSTYVEPTDEPNSLYAASLGTCYVSLTYSVTNKDRGGSLNFMGGEWDPRWSVNYGGENYYLWGFDLNGAQGKGIMNLAHSAVLLNDTLENKGKHDTSNTLISAGTTESYCTFGIVDVDPEALTDGFELTVEVPNPGAAPSQFVFTVPAR